MTSIYTHITLQHSGPAGGPITLYHTHLCSPGWGITFARGNFSAGFSFGHVFLFRVKAGNAGSKPITTFHSNSHMISE